MIVSNPFLAKERLLWHIASVNTLEFILVTPTPVPVDRELDAVIEAQRLREEEERSNAFLESLLRRKPGSAPLVRVV